MEYTNELYCYRVRISAKENYIVPKLFSAKDIYQYLCQHLNLPSASHLFISDMFSAGFICKPISFDNVTAESDNDYKILKKIKSAQYIDCNLLADTVDGLHLIRKISSGTAAIKDGYIYPVYEGFSLCFTPYKDDTNSNPFVINIFAGGLLDFYICAPFALIEQIANLCTIEINGCQFDMLSFDSTTNSLGGNEAYFITTDTAVNPYTSITPLDLSDSTTPSSKFRLKYDAFLNVQKFRRGSVFIAEDNVFSADANTFNPYYIFLRGI